jgi:hypothetical protein
MAGFTNFFVVREEKDRAVGGTESRRHDHEDLRFAL